MRIEDFISRENKDLGMGIRELTCDEYRVFFRNNDSGTNITLYAN